MQLTQQNGVCLVSGSATGIGAASALEYASHGWQVGVMNFGEATRAAAEAVVTKIEGQGAAALLLECDVRDDTACRAAASAARSAAPPRPSPPATTAAPRDRAARRHRPGPATTR